MQKITPFLWFTNNAEEAADYYLSVFRNGKRLSTMPGPDGKVLCVSFEIAGQEFVALNGRPEFSFTEAVSFFVSCDTQEEIDHFWNTLTAGGGQESRCGWLKDKYGLSWQIIPPILMELMRDKDRAKAGRVMQAMLQMRKIDIAGLEKAAAGH